MYKVKINKATDKANGYEATLLQADNLHVNGKMVVKNEYKTQQTLAIGSTYPLSTEAIKTEIVADGSYAVSGSWIGGVLHCTSMVVMPVVA